MRVRKQLRLRSAIALGVCFGTLVLGWQRVWAVPVAPPPVEEVCEDCGWVTETDEVCVADRDALEAEKETLEGELSTLEGGLSTLQSELSAREGELSTLQSELSDLNSQLTALNTQLTTLQAERQGLADDIQEIAEEKHVGVIEDIAGFTETWVPGDLEDVEAYREGLPGPLHETAHAAAALADVKAGDARRLAREIRDNGKEIQRLLAAAADLEAKARTACSAGTGS